MLVRTLTIGGNPNIQHILYFDSVSNATKAPEVVNDRFTITDDYGQTLSIHKEAVVICDIIQNGMEVMRAQGEMKIIEVKGQSKLQKRFESDAELKILRDEMARKQREAPPVEDFAR